MARIYYIRRRFTRRRYRRRYRRKNPYTNGQSYQKIETTYAYAFPPQGQEGKGGFLIGNQVAHALSFRNIITDSTKWNIIQSSYRVFRVMGLQIKVVIGKHPENLGPTQNTAAAIGVYPGAKTNPNHNYIGISTNNRNMFFTGFEERVVTKYFPLRSALPKSYSLVDIQEPDPVGWINITTNGNADAVVGASACITFTWYIKFTITQL